MSTATICAVVGLVFRVEGTPQSQLLILETREYSSNLVLAVSDGVDVWDVSISIEQLHSLKEAFETSNSRPTDTKFVLSLKPSKPTFAAKFTDATGAIRQCIVNLHEASKEANRVQLMLQRLHVPSHESNQTPVVKVQMECILEDIRTNMLNGEGWQKEISQILQSSARLIHEREKRIKNLLKQLDEKHLSTGTFAWALPLARFTHYCSSHHFQSTSKPLTHRCIKTCTK